MHLQSLITAEVGLEAPRRANYAVDGISGAADLRRFGRQDEPLTTTNAFVGLTEAIIRDILNRPLRNLL